MDPINLVTTRCVSCDGKGIPETLRPYCSIVCRVLGQSGLGWRMNPCRIVDLSTGIVLTSGPELRTKIGRAHV